MRIQNITAYPHSINSKLNNVSKFSPQTFLGDDDDDKKSSSERKVALGAKLACATMIGVGIGLLIANRQKIMQAFNNRFRRDAGRNLPNNRPPALPLPNAGTAGTTPSSTEIGTTSVANKIEEIASTFKTPETSPIEVVEVVEVISKNKVEKPEFLYHMTSESAFKSIMRDCLIKKSSIEDGVFLSDLKSLEKYPKGELQNMANWYAGGCAGMPMAPPKGDKIYIFKIPSEVLKDKLDFRAISLMSAPVTTKNPFIGFSMYGAEETAKLLEKPLEFVHRGEIPVAFSSDIIEFSSKDILKPDFKKVLLDKLK